MDRQTRLWEEYRAGLEYTDHLDILSWQAGTALITVSFTALGVLIALGTHGSMTSIALALVGLIITSTLLSTWCETRNHWGFQQTVIQERMQEIERSVDAHLFRLLLAVKHRLSPGYSRGLDAVRCVQREIEPEPYPKADAVAGIDDLRAYETKHARTSIKWELDSLALSTMGAWLVLLFFEVAVRLARPVPFWPDSLRPLTRAPQVYLVIAGSVIVLAFLFWRFGNRLARFVPRRATARQQVRTDSDSGIAGA